MLPAVSWNNTWGTIPRKAATWGQQEISAVAPSKYIFWNITSACKSLLGHIVVALLKARVDMNRRHKIEIYMVGCEREFSWSACKTDFFVLESLHPFKFSDLVDTPSQGIFISFPFQTAHPWQHFCMVWQILRSSIPKQITDMFTIIYGGLFTSILHCMTFNSKKKANISEFGANKGWNSQDILLQRIICDVSNFSLWRHLCSILNP